MNYLPPGSEDYAVIVGWDWWCELDREHRLDEWLSGIQYDEPDHTRF
jgi:hypothetical protein